MEFYNRDVEDALNELHTTAQGLSQNEAEARLARDGRNVLQAEKKAPFIVKFLRQFKDAMTLILIAAAVISGVFGELADMIIIAAIVLLNAILGVTQEAKAEKAVEALQKLSQQRSRVRRQGQVMNIDSAGIVTGDIVLLDAGDSVPCDMRLIECRSLKIEEAALTGESVPSDKNTDALGGGTAGVGDRSNMAFMGTSVSNGRGIGVATGTGMNTEVGRIAHILNTTKTTATPLQKQINKIGKMLSVAILVICVVMFGVNCLRHGVAAANLLEYFMGSVSLAVAAIPEGLSVVITLVMAMGVTKLSRKNAIIRKMPAIETLGGTGVICSDKTGTLTQNRMTVMRTFTLGGAADEEQLIKTAVLANDTKVSEAGALIGDTTETALVAYAIKNDRGYDNILSGNVREDEVPFDSVRKLMSTLNKGADGQLTVHTKGAPDELLQRCSFAYKAGKAVPMTDEIRNAILKENKAMAEGALRVLGFASKPHPGGGGSLTEKDEAGLTFLGLMGMIDPVRPEVKAAVEKCFKAGVTPVMITGDHLITAVAIGRELGIIKDGELAVTGKELDAMPDAEYEKKIGKIKVYARVSPENKVRIVRAWQKRGQISAMTGDGVNDAPALKAADIGVGMGITGTDVTKNVADIVLADDNFATIVVAVEEGRKIYDNIKKAVQFLLSSNVCEVLTLFVAAVIGFTILTPVQILWVNLVTDTVPALGLGQEKAEKNIMSRPPRDPKKSIFSDGLGLRIGYQSVLMAGLVLAAYFIGASISEAAGRTMAFAVLSLTQIAHSFNLRHQNDSIFDRELFKNKTLTFGALIVTVLTFALVFIPWVNSTVFKLVPLSLTCCAAVLGLAVAIIPLEELAKAIRRTAASRRRA